MPKPRPATTSLAARTAAAVVAAVLTAATVVLGLATAADAHPHIWVRVRATVLYENGAIVAIRHAWTFDEYYTAMAIEGLDANKDGIYAREELAELAKVNIEALKEFGYFTFPKLKGQELLVGAPRDYYLVHGERKVDAAAAKPPGEPVLPRTGADQIANAAKGPAKELTLNFTLPLAKPVLADADGFGFSMGDPTFFIAFEPADAAPVTLGDGAPRGCRVSSPQVAAPDANPSKPGDLMASKPSDLSVNIVSGPAWQVTCAPAG